MLICPICREVYPNGTVLCLCDGHVFQTVAALPAPQETPLVPVLPLVTTLELSLEHCGDTAIPTGEEMRWSFALDTIGDPPLRIGRRDESSHPPIHPEVDLSPMLKFTPSPLSRIQAALERNDGRLCVRAVSQRVHTWHSRTGEPRAKRLALDQYVALADYDKLYFGDPSGQHVRLRVRILHP